MNVSERNLKIAQERVEAAESELQLAREELNAVRGIYYNIKVGDRVRSTSTSKRSGGLAGTVKRVKWWTEGKPWLEIYADKKDGTPGMARRALYGEWEHIA